MIEKPLGRNPSYTNVTLQARQDPLLINIKSTFNLLTVFSCYIDFSQQAYFVQPIIILVIKINFLFFDSHCSLIFSFSRTLSFREHNFFLASGPIDFDFFFKWLKYRLENVYIIAPRLSGSSRRGQAPIFFTIFKILLYKH